MYIVGLRWRSENDYGFTYEYAYQYFEYIIRAITLSVLSAPVIHSACNRTLGFPAPVCTTITLCHSEHMCDQVA